MTESSELGSQKKAEYARRMRVARRAGYRYFDGKPGMGKRFLTDRELDVWYARLEGHMVAKRQQALKGKK